jgi:hypothetical protein
MAISLAEGGDVRNAEVNEAVSRLVPLCQLYQTVTLGLDPRVTGYKRVTVYL